MISPHQTLQQPASLCPLGAQQRCVVMVWSWHQLLPAHPTAHDDDDDDDDA